MRFIGWAVIGAGIMLNAILSDGAAAGCYPIFDKSALADSLAAGASEGCAGLFIHPRLTFGVLRFAFSSEGHS